VVQGNEFVDDESKSKKEDDPQTLILQQIPQLEIFNNEKAENYRQDTKMGEEEKKKPKAEKGHKKRRKGVQDKK